MYRQRTIEGYFRRASEQFPVMLVTGARQVGKTTFLSRISEEGRRYVTLDDPLLLNLAKTDPGLFLSRFSPPVIIDEIQYAPELLPFIKMEVDRTGLPGLFWLTGSQHFHLMKGVSESLAGRVGIVRLLGLSRREAENAGYDSPPFLPDPVLVPDRLASGGGLGLKDLYRTIWRGSFPALALNPGMDRDLFYSSYVETYLKRDVRDLARVGDEAAFTRFLRACAARTAGLLNMAELARDADIAPNTAKSWLSILEASGIVYLLEPFHANVTKRLIKTPKLYFLDTGLCAWLTGWSSPETLEAGAQGGQILETWIFAELLKSFWHNGKTAPFFFFRDREQNEIDLLIVQDGTAYPLEFKKSAAPKKEDAKAFPALSKLKIPVGPGGVICLYPDFLPLSDGVFSIPVGAV
ncbi:MAG: ATP-binding protein [Deltaproteobacteria bacterium]|nr:ATP-binding protein [Deltaproteobacteria bacterium]